MALPPLSSKVQTYCLVDDARAVVYSYYPLSEVKAAALSDHEWMHTHHLRWMPFDLLPSNYREKPLYSRDNEKLFVPDIDAGRSCLPPGDR